MSDAIIVGVLTLLGNGLAVFFSNRKTQALLTYRIDQLEKKVEKHNNVIERTYELEKNVEILSEKISELQRE